MIPLVYMMVILEHQNQRYQTQHRSFLCNKNNGKPSMLLAASIIKLFHNVSHLQLYIPTSHNAADAENMGVALHDDDDDDEQNNR